jgi:arginine decarboxylase
MSQARRELGRRALVVDDEVNDHSAAGHAARRLVEELKSGQIEVIIATTAEDPRAIFASDAAVQCVVLDWDLKAGVDHACAAALLSEIRACNASAPIFLVADRSLASTIPAKSMQEAGDLGV